MHLVQYSTCVLKRNMQAKNVHHALILSCVSCWQETEKEAINRSWKEEQELDLMKVQGDSQGSPGTAAWREASRVVFSGWILPKASQALWRLPLSSFHLKTGRSPPNFCDCTLACWTSANIGYWLYVRSLPYKSSQCLRILARASRKKISQRNEISHHVI